MKSSVRLTVAVALALVAAQGVQASASAHAVTPSAAQAKHATRLEVITRYTILDARTSHHAVTLNIGCRRLRQRLYRCSFWGETATDLYEYAVSGRSMVHFDKHAHVSLYDVSCSTYNFSNYITFDFGC
jgi:hypothetical protein